jgi:hypothetical protein
MNRQAVRVVVGLVAVVCVLVSAVSAWADTTVDFEQFAPGTTITNQYADLGGSGQGVVFGPLPGGQAGLNPVIRTPPAGQAQSGTQVADISTCFGCEFYVPNTTGTFVVPRSQVSVDVGYLGPPATCSGAPSDSACAFVTLLAFDAGGKQIAASPQTMVAQNAGVHTLLSVSTPSATIVGFEVTARTDGSDDNKQIAIDDLAFDTPTTPPPPDFTLTPATTNVNLVQGGGATDAIAIGRIGGSNGLINLAVSGTLPTGVHAQLAPNPAGGAASTLTLTADPSAPPTVGTNPQITVTGTPAGSSAGSAPRSFTVTVGVQQAFDVSVLGPTSIDLSSCSPNVPVQVTRNLSFGTPVSLSVTGLPPGVQAGFSPAQITFPAGSGSQNAELDLTAPHNGQTILRRAVTIHASAPPLTDRTATITVGGTCPLQYDAEVVSMQITQGTQLPVLPQRDPGNPGAPIPYATIGQAGAPGTQEALAKLAAFKPTVVRVYADLRYGPASGISVPAVLKGFSYDRSGNLVALPGSPILPIATPGKLTLGLAALGADFLQDNNTGVYTFTLPSSWAVGNIELEADLLPSQSGPAPPVSASVSAHTAALPGQPATWGPCTTSACQIDGRFTISKIPFLYTFPFTIRPLAMIVTNPYDATLPDPETTFKWARLVTPIPLIVEPYAATIDIGDLIGRSNSSGDVTIDALKKVITYVCNHGEPAHGADVGIQHNDIRSAQAIGNVCWQDYGLVTHSFAFVNAPEPLVSVSHELFHLLGRPHASAACGAAIGLGGNGTQSAETWPADQHGYLQSVGLAPASPGSGNPYELIPAGPGTVPAAQGQWYDFMTYCDHVSDGDPLGPSQNGWVSVHNWNAILSDFGYAASAQAARRAAPTARAAANPRTSAPVAASLDVTASVASNGRVTILDVEPVRTAAPRAPVSPYHLVATGGRPADVPMRASYGHIDSRQPQAVLMLTGVVPAAGVRSIGILGNGVTLATRKKSAHRPVVTIAQLPSFHAGNATVRWRAADQDGDSLQVEVDYSGDGGHTFKPVWIGPNRGHARLPERYLFRSANARIRVVVNDGFQSTTVRSRRFRSPGAAPSVQILLPWPHSHQPNDAPLVLSGQAFDDRSRLLSGHQLRWMLGRRLLGTGAQISVSGLPAGAHRISLVARDRAGRAATDSIVVGLRATRPLFLELQAPRRLGRKARSLRLTVSSSLGAKLVVRGAGRPAQRFAVGRHARRLSVRVVRGRKRLSLRLSLSAGGLTRTSLLTVPRPS